MTQKEIRLAPPANSLRVPDIDPAEHPIEDIPVDMGRIAIVGAFEDPDLDPFAHNAAAAQTVTYLHDRGIIGHNALVSLQGIGKVASGRFVRESQRFRLPDRILASIDILGNNIAIKNRVPGQGINYRTRMMHRFRSQPIGARLSRSDLDIRDQLDAYAVHAWKRFNEYLGTTKHASDKSSKRSVILVTSSEIGAYFDENASEEDLRDGGILTLYRLNGGYRWITRG